jgi:uncharacterized protein involved in exopolysaccharide biosynthesis
MPTVNEVVREAPLGANIPATTEFHFLDLLLVLAGRKRLIFLTTLAGLLIAALLSFIVPPIFTATAVIMPPQQEESGASALMGQFGALASLTGVGNSLGLKNPNDLYLGILKSQTIADALIKQFNLLAVYHAKTPSGGRKLLAGRSKFISGKDSLISISVLDTDPRRAAAIANAYVNQLHEMNSHLAITQASQRRVFFQEQLSNEKDRLADAEAALKQTEEETGIIEPTGQMETTIRQIAQIQAEITAHEVQLDALRMSSTAQNPDVVRLTTELASLRQQEQDLENRGQGKHLPGDISITSASAPRVGLEYVRKQRDVKYHQLLFDLLARQYEAARIDEAKAAPVIQVVDPALVPDRKSSPWRALWTVIGGFLGFLFSCGWVVTSTAYRRLQADPEQGAKLAMLRSELRLRG